MCFEFIFPEFFWGIGEKKRGEERSLSYREAKTEKEKEGVCSFLVWRENTSSNLEISGRKKEQHLRVFLFLDLNMWEITLRVIDFRCRGSVPINVF